MLADILEKVKILESDLKQIDCENPDILKKSEKSIYCISSCLKKLKEQISKIKFSNQEAEIVFFKEIKPSVYSKLIYFIKIFNIESKLPNGSDKSQKKYLQNELNKLEKFFAENLEFYQYMRNKMTFLDDKYFVRGKFEIRLYLDTFTYDADPEFSTSHDFKVAKVMANDLLNVYLKSELAILERKELSGVKSLNLSKGKYSWTESKVSLIELIYAIQASGCINQGMVDIKELALFFETLFNVDLGDYYRTYLQIKSRQQPAKFLETLKASLIKKIEEQDE